MTPPQVEPSAQQLELLSLIVCAVAKFHHLSPEEAKDFTLYVETHLVEGRYHVFSRYTGRSSLRTYLTVVVERMLLDWRRAR
jgi:hypothetical protein